MPATFSHCIIARESIQRLGKVTPYPGILKQMNHFVVMGSTGPDYPYLTDVIKYGLLHIGHNWANRMHYENIDAFIREGIKKLSMMDKSSEQFNNCLAWFSGYVSHIIADSFVHPVVNCTVGGTYIFTSKEHGRCELVQDIYIFNKKTGTDISNAAARDSASFGYLNILDDCSDPQNIENIHPHIKYFWTDILKTVHSHASDYFEQINPDEWHKNYKNRVDFAADGRSIFRHVLDIANAPRYVPWADIDNKERIKYIENVVVPRSGAMISYDNLFDRTADQVVSAWKALFPCIESGSLPTDTFVKDWNLDTGVDESKIDLWMEAKNEKNILD
ncbi:MAG: zinc dependent phospholipase C family protein [Nitrospirota bacterium]